jgi:GDPmannose 4,6-dehydratase
MTTPSASPVGRGSAIVTGSTGQDGYYLVARLLAEGYHVHATVRDETKTADLRALPAVESLTIHELDLSDARGYGGLIADVQPDELYNFAGQSSIAASFQAPGATWRTNADAVQMMLEAVREHSPHTRFYQSSSTDMFGSTSGGAVIHDESSRLEPQSPYAAAKAAAHLLCDAYRRAFDLRIACGILANHESRRRPASFLSRKVVDHVKRLREASAVGTASGPALAVGNLAAQRDWGFAPDYVDGIVRVTRQISYRAQTSGEPAEPDVGSNYRDYVLGSGRLHAVWELIDRAFALGGLPLEWDRSDPEPARWSARLLSTGSPVVLVDLNLMRPSDPAAIGADPTLARGELGWQPTAGLDRFLVDMLAG